MTKLRSPPPVAAGALLLLLLHPLLPVASIPDNDSQLVSNQNVAQPKVLEDTESLGLSTTHDRNSGEQQQRSGEGSDGSDADDSMAMPLGSVGWPWPWNHKNKTDGGGGDNPSCASHKNCSDCTSSSWGCHWCTHDNACHPIGSVHGCLTGATCNSTDGGGGKGGDDKKHRNKTDTSCASHTKCSECAASSWGCHWCAHDEACHPIGSVHGCIAGVNCYSNDRCTRKEPEPIEAFVFQDIGTIPLVVVMSLSALVLCCATCCLGAACCMRGTYEDYATLAVANADASVLLGEEIDISDAGRRKKVVIVRDDEEEEGDGEKNDDDANGDFLRQDDEGEERGEYQPLVENDNVDDETRFTMARSAHTRMLTRESNTQCMFNSCKICYAVTVCFVAAFAVVGTVYSPKKPDYNVCSDAVAWKSIVDGMTSLKMEASFQLLMSVENPNHFEVDIAMGSGNFKHDGAYVGSFNIAPTSIKSMSITDLLVSVTFTPDKWEALSLTAEYYKGTLAFMVDLDVAVKVPALGGFTYEAKFDNYKVLANDPKLQDRHLCLCQKNEKGGAPKSSVVTGPFPIADH